MILRIAKKPSLYTLQLPRRVQSSLGDRGQHNVIQQGHRLHWCAKKVFVAFWWKISLWMFWRRWMLFALHYTIGPFWWELWNGRTKCASHLQWNVFRFIQNLNSGTTHLYSTMWRQIPKSSTSWPETHSLIMMRSLLRHSFNSQLLLNNKWKYNKLIIIIWFTRDYFSDYRNVIFKANWT